MQILYKQYCMVPHNMANGLRNRFTVDDFAAANDGSKIFVRWYALWLQNLWRSLFCDQLASSNRTLRGTFEGQQDTAYGMALLTVNDDCLIEKTEVFRCNSSLHPCFGPCFVPA